MSPARVLDTGLGLGAPRRSIAAHATLVVQIAGQGGLPATGISAVALTTQVVTPSASGYAVVYAAGTRRPGTSNVEFVAGHSTAALVITSLSGDGRITIYNGSGGTVRLIADVSGYYVGGTPTAPGAYAPVGPTRVFDTGLGLGVARGSVPAHSTLTVQIAGRGGVPASGATAAAIVVHAITPASSGYLTVFGAGTPRPFATNLEFTAGQSAANVSITSLGSGGRISIYNGSAGPVRILGDVDGFQLAGAPATPGGYVPSRPSRVVDTGTGVGTPKVALGPHSTLTIKVAGHGGVPSAGTSAVAVTVEVVAPGASGYLTAYQSRTTRPGTTNIQFTAHQNATNAALIPLSNDGLITFYNGAAGPVRLIVDVFGFLPTPFTPVTNLLAETWQTPGGVTLTWSPPTTTGLSRVVIRRATGTRAPPSLTSGTLVAEVRAGTGSFTDTGLAPGTTYSYALFAQNVAGVVADPVDATATPRAASAITWSSGTNVDASHGGAGGVSCTSPTFCLALDGDRPAKRFDGTAWSDTSATGLPNAFAATCLSPTYCLALSPRGQAATYNGATWRALPPTPKPPGNEENFVGSVSCISSSWCMAVATLGPSYIWSAGVWKAVPIPGIHTQMLSVSCASTTFCETVDPYGSAYTFNGTGWSSPNTPIPGGYLYSVSCPAVGFCIAGGRNADALPAVIQLAGGSWGSPTAVGTSTRYGVASLSCSSSSFCAAEIDGAGPQDGYVTTFDGRAWTTPTDVDPQGPSVGHVSCVQKWCMYVDQIGNSSSFDGTSWSPTTAFNPPRGVPMAISCPTGGFCVAVDLYGNALVRDGTTWGAPVKVVPNGYLSSVSCASATLCLATGVSHSDGSQVTVTFDGTSWSAPKPFDDLPAGAAPYISCAATTFCAAVGTSRLDATHDEYVVRTFDGTSWSPITVVPSSSIVSASIDALSCPTTSYCLGLGERAILQYTGGTWTYRLQSPGFLPRAVSCLAAADCYVAIGNDVYRFDGTAWSPPSVPAPGEIGSISCPTSTLCAISSYIDGSTYTFTFDGNTWSAGQPLDSTNLFLGYNYLWISCPAQSSTCTAINSAGTAFTGTH